MTCFRMATGEAVFSYCRRNNLSYNSVWEKLDNGIDAEKAVEITAIRRGKKGVIKYTYKDMPLIDYCRQNGLNYGRMRNKLIKGEL